MILFIISIIKLIFPFPAFAQDIDLRNSTSPYRTIFYVGPSDYVRVFVNFAFGAAGVISFLYLLIGGLQWITAGGDKDGIDKARRKIVGALIGLTITFSLYVFVFLIGYLFNVDLQQFNIPTI